MTAPLPKLERVNVDDSIEYVVKKDDYWLLRDNNHGYYRVVDVKAREQAIIKKLKEAQKYGKSRNFYNIKLDTLIEELEKER